MDGTDIIMSDKNEIVFAHLVPLAYSAINVPAKIPRGTPIITAKNTISS